MKGNCKDCAKRETCKKDIGNMLGYCNTDFVPEEVSGTKKAEFFGRENTIRRMCDEVDTADGTNVGLVAILSVGRIKAFSPEYRKPEYQLFRLGGGFGTKPDAMGNACFGHYCADGEHAREERYNFIGIADEETTKFAEELEAKWRDKVGAKQC